MVLLAPKPLSLSFLKYATDTNAKLLGCHRSIENI